MLLRIQRQRKKGWRMPENTISCTRPSRFANPYKIGDPDPHFLKHPMSREAVISRYDQWLKELQFTGRLRVFLYPLRDKNLACYCKLCRRHKDGKPLGELCLQCLACHVDVLAKYCKLFL